MSDDSFFFFSLFSSSLSYTFVIYKISALFVSRDNDSIRSIIRQRFVFAAEIPNPPKFALYSHFVKFGTLLHGV